MGSRWQTHVYFRYQTRYSFEFIQALIEQFTAAGCTFLNPRVGYQSGNYMLAPDWDFLNTSDLNMVIEKLVLQEAGSIQLWHLAEDIDFSLAFGKDSVTQAKETSLEFGEVELSVDNANFWHDPADVTRRRYQLVFALSNILARTIRPLYGWGDSDYGFDIPFRLSDLVRWDIPRLSWWNYFSHEYIEHVGKGRLITHGAAYGKEDEHGLTIIMKLGD